ncbi:hypothetical protein [Neotabrizicola sp. sgz301269]|uniref:cysteine dioxygenase family protein n=1 Tax=Neotabrizicola sp. sgz301269 TaxID=3276282 RepID=UPI00376FE27D
MTPNPLRDFVVEMTRLSDRESEEARLFREATPLMADLIRRPDWLPRAYAQPSLERYQQYLLYCDPLQRFSLVSFVWGPGQQTPVHDHTTWGLIGVLEGAEQAQKYALIDGIWRPQAEEEMLEPGGLDAVSPTIGDVHRVRNAWKDRTSISIHLYGGNIGQIDRHVFDPNNGQVKPFRSGYALDSLPNIWI